MHGMIIFLQCLSCALNGRRYYSKNPLLRCQIHGGLYPAAFASTMIVTWCLSFKGMSDQLKDIPKNWENKKPMKKWLNLNIMAFFGGIWCVLDGVGSIAVYWNQSPLEHLVRIVRALVGVLLISFTKKRIMDREEYDLMTAKIGDLEGTVARLKEHRADDRTITILRDDLGKSQKRIEDLKGTLQLMAEEVERYKEEAMRQINEKKALYERLMGSDKR